jgi:transcriptional regulator with XRE-family HTH domain
MRQTVINSGIAREHAAGREVLGARLRAQRESRGWTYRQLAGKLSDASAGICPVPQIESIVPQIRRWERGTARVGERYRALYCIAFGMGLELWDGRQS